MVEVEVSCSDPAYRKVVSGLHVKQFVQDVCRHENTDNVLVSVSFVPEAEIRELNRSYRGIDESTDVLSFAEKDVDESVPFVSGRGGCRKVFLGEIIICPEVVSQNADFFKVKIIEELHRLLIHGILHLNGWNHETNSASEPMLERQERILTEMEKPSKEDV